MITVHSNTQDWLVTAIWAKPQVPSFFYLVAK